MIMQRTRTSLSVFFGALLTFALFAGCAHTQSDSADASSKTEPGFDPELTSYTYPFPVKTFEFESQKQTLKMAYMDVVPTTPNGRSVVLLHGKNFSGAYWEPTARALAERGYRVIIPDQIGFGKSTKPETYQYTFQTLARNTAALLDALGVQRVSIVAHSMGGMLGTRFALMFPDRVQSLTLVNPIGLQDWKTVVPYKTVDEQYRQELQATPQSIKDYQRNAYFGGQWKPEYDRLTEVLSGWTVNPRYPLVAWNSALTADMIFTQPVVYEFPLLRVSTLLIIGQKDRTAIGKAWAPEAAAKNLGNYPVLGRKTARAIPGARLVEIANAGHLPQVETFDVYSEALVRFLSDTAKK